MDDLENQRQLLQQAMEELRRSGSVSSEAIERMAKSANMSEAEARKLAKSFGTTAGLSKKLSDNLKFAGQQAKETGRDLAGLAKGLLNNQGELSSITPAFNIAGRAASLAGKGVGKFAELLGDGIQSLGMMFKNPLVIAGTTILGGALKGLGTAVAAAAEKSASMAVEAANFYTQMMDSYLTVYKRAGQLGIAASSGLGGLAATANQSRMSLDSFVAQISKHSQDLAFTFDNTAAGAYRLAQTQNQMRKTGVERQFRNLGLGLEEQNDILATTTKIQSMTNRKQVRDTAAMSASAEAFGKQLILLSKVTGQSVESLQNKVNEDLRSERFGTYLASLEAEQAKDFMAAGALLSRFGPGIEKGFKDAVAGFQTEDARKFFAATGGLGQDILEDFKQTRDVGVFANRIRDSLADTAMAVSGGDLKSLAQLGDAGTVLGGNINALVRATKDRDVDYNEFLPKVREEIERLSNATDPTTKNLTAAAETIADSRVKIQDAFLKTLPKASEYLNFFADTVLKSIDSLGDLIAEIQKLIGKRDTVDLDRPGYEHGQMMTLTSTRRRNKTREVLTEEERKKLDDLAKKELIAEGKHKNGQVTYVDKMAKAAEMVEQGRFKGKYQQGAQDLLDFIAQKESGGSYTKLVGGEEKQDLTGMTVGQVLEFQKNMVTAQSAGGKGLPSGAVGKYQIISPTLESLIKQDIVTKDELFSPKTQDRLGKALLQRRGYDEYASGKISVEEFADRLAKEWAALPTATGASHYQGQNGNQSLVSRNDLIAAVKNVPKLADGGITQGVSIAGEAGPEAVVPLPDGRTIPVQIQNSSLLSDEEIRRIYGRTDPKEIGATVKEYLISDEARKLMSDPAAIAKQLEYNKAILSDPTVISRVANDIKFMADGGITQGVSIAGEAGPEAVVPLPNGRTIPVQIQNSSLLSDEEIRRIYGRTDPKEIGATVKEYLISDEARKLMSDPAAIAKQLEYNKAILSDPTVISRVANDIKFMARGGITNGLSFAGEAGPEAVVPLPDGRTIPVKISLSEIAESLGAFDKSTQTITDPEIWKKILPIGTMYDMGKTSYGAPAIPGITQEIIGELVKLRDQGSTKEQALALVVQELKTSLQSFYANVNASGNTEQLSRLDEIVNLMRSNNNLNDKMLRQSQ